MNNSQVQYKEIVSDQGVNVYDIAEGLEFNFKVDPLIINYNTMFISFDYTEPETIANNTIKKITAYTPISQAQYEINGTTIVNQSYLQEQNRNQIILFDNVQMNDTQFYYQKVSDTNKLVTVSDADVLISAKFVEQRYLGIKNISGNQFGNDTQYDIYLNQSEMAQSTGNQEAEQQGTTINCKIPLKYLLGGIFEIDEYIPVLHKSVLKIKLGSLRSQHINDLEEDDDDPAQISNVKLCFNTYQNLNSVKYNSPLSYPIKIIENKLFETPQSVLLTLDQKYDKILYILFGLIRDDADAQLDQPDGSLNRHFKGLVSESGNDNFTKINLQINDNKMLHDVSPMDPLFKLFLQNNSHFKSFDKQIRKTQCVPIYLNESVSNFERNIQFSFENTIGNGGALCVSTCIYTGQFIVNWQQGVYRII